MEQPPLIIVQLIHIQGPMKGDIQEYSKDMISIGRDPSCDLRFPANLSIVSRRHAQIVREGNQFRVIDQSANGTFVNGKRVKEILLKKGDVLELAHGGPKMSFLIQMREAPVESETPPPQSFERHSPEANGRAFARPVSVNQAISSSSPPPVIPRDEPAEANIPVADVPVIIQCGRMIRSFKELPVTVGSHPRCDFTIDQPGILDKHAQVLYMQNKYWIKDLTGQSLVKVNQQPIPFQAPLVLNDTISLGPHGPVFRFIGDGRLVDVTESTAERPESAKSNSDSSPRTGDKGEKPPDGVFSKLKKLF